MARTILVAGAAAWLVAGAAGIGLSLLGIGWLSAVLPPLSIDADALRGAVTAVAAGVVGVGVAHVAVLAGLRSARRRSRSAGVLLGAFLSATLLALAAAAGTSAIAWPQNAPAFIGAAVVAGLGATAYAAVVGLLIGEMRNRSAN